MCALPAAGDVSAGRTHSLALTLQGEVYAWGSNVHGQLGLPVAQDSVRPARTLSPSPVSLCLGLAAEKPHPQPRLLCLTSAVEAALEAEEAAAEPAEAEAAEGLAAEAEAQRRGRASGSTCPWALRQPVGG